jgi:serine/threonine-protein kinase
LGRVLKGKYRLERRLGAGGFGAVYAGRQLLTDTLHAVKLMHGALGDQPGLKERLRDEARTGMQLHHPRIVRVTDFDVEAEVASFPLSGPGGPPPPRGGRVEVLFLVMDLIESRTLAMRMRETPADVRAHLEDWARDVAAALDYAHSRGVVHRDVKPANILVREEDQAALLTDFGISRAVHDVGLTQPGTTLGTYAYMAPEQWRGEERSIDARTDVYAFAAMLFELVCGRAAFGTGPEAVHGHLHLPPPPVAQLRPGLPAGLDAVFARGLAKAPGDRPPTATALATDVFAQLQVGEAPTVSASALSAPRADPVPDAIATVSVIRSVPPGPPLRGGPAAVPAARPPRPVPGRALLLGGLSVVIVVLAAALAAVALRSQAGSPGQPTGGAPTAAPQLRPSALVLTLADLPGYTVRPAATPISNSDSTAEVQFESGRPPTRIVVSLANVTYNQQTAAEQYQSTRNAHLAGGLRETPAPALGQAASMFTNDQTSVLLWRHGPVVCQISTSATVPREDLVAFGQKQDARVRAALGGG